MKDTFASRRAFLQNVSLTSLGATAAGRTFAAEPKIPDAKILGEAGVETAERSKAVWRPVSDRRIRVGLVGHGFCKFGAAFGFQDHPNVAVVAVRDLFPDRCAEMAKACRCAKTYPSLEEMVKDDTIKGVFVATDAPSHARHCIEVLKHGKHVATAVPAVWGSLDDAHMLYETVKASGRKYMMSETSAFHADLHAMRQIYKAGGFGKLVHSEGEYLHYLPTVMEGFRDWRRGSIPMWYPTHANAYPACVSGCSFTEVSCLGWPSHLPHYQAANNPYKNPFGTEVALMRTSEGGMARFTISYDTPGFSAESGRVRGERGSFYGQYQGLEKRLPDLSCPPLPPGVAPGGHGGSHGQLMNEFVTAILEDRQPLVHIRLALNMSVAGVVAHRSALKGGELLKIPQYQL